MRSKNRCPECNSIRIKPKYSNADLKFMKFHLSAKLFADLKKDRKCEDCGYIWIEKMS